MTKGEVGAQHCPFFCIDGLPLTQFGMYVQKCKRVHGVSNYYRMKSEVLQ
ncbi:protein of unknown function [Paenibacillus alvei]|uniref:Uncharacterized protein n=1 Tax=Paenibacillus alvei TaxID=44250 RepID=A0A383RKI9_PAEAL|nr:protein of unknown function [Paenibacillus alvei]